MVQKCGKCQCDILKGSDILSCSECKDFFHPVSCTRVKTQESFKKMSAAAKSNWKCDACKSETSSISSKSEENCSEKSESGPVLAAISKLSDEINKKIDLRFDKLTEDIADMKDSFDVLRQEVAAVKKSQESIVSDVSVLKEENISLKGEVNLLRSQVVDLQQYSRINNVIITGIPVTPNEDMLSILGNVAEVLHVPFKKTDVSAAHRLAIRKGETRPPSIVVQFVSRASKAEWIRAKKVKKTLSSTELRGSLPKYEIFINEHLTHHTMASLERARALTKTGQLLYAWVRDCKVFVRKEPTGPAIRILNLNELEMPIVQK